MAKITANGDMERFRFRHPETGAELIYTSRGRLLKKSKGGKIKLYDEDRPKATEELVFKIVAEAGMERV